VARRLLCRMASSRKRARYADTENEYRHVILPMDVAAKVPRGRLLTETEWRDLGVQQSRGWVHYMLHAPEPHILLFRRPKPDPTAQEAAAAAQRLGGLGLAAGMEGRNANPMAFK